MLDPLDNRQYIYQRYLDFQENFLHQATPQNIQYNLIKSVYLILRHRLTAGNILLSYLNYTISLDIIPLNALLNLYKELEILNGQTMGTNLFKDLVWRRSLRGEKTSLSEMLKMANLL